MEDVQQRARTLALPEMQCATLGERIVQAARLAVIEHLRQMSQLPIVIGGADHATGDQHEPIPNQNNRGKREAA